MKNILIILSILLTISCSLDRTNPLDPLVSGEDYPEEVPNIEVSVIGSDIEITWTPMSNINGYYIYRSQSYDGFYENITDVEDEEAVEDSYLDDEVNIPGSFYWYKMSAYKIVAGENLEGYRSEPKTWN